MLGASVTDPSWVDQVPADRPTMVVAEGLTMYLDPADGHELFRRVAEHFPSGEVFFDGYSKFGVRTQESNAIVRRAKATLRWGIDDPRELKEAGLTLVSCQTAEAFVPEEDWARLPVVQRQLHRAFLRLPGLRNIRKPLRYRFGS
jgi:O-methyltransferase involved in polyketide biosynthesis